MLTQELSDILVEQYALPSHHLRRYVLFDVYRPKTIAAALPLLLLNDGQDGEELQLSSLLNGLFHSGKVQPLVCVAIHAGRDRKNEYGVAGVPDYAGRGSKAGAYLRFVTEELLPFLSGLFGATGFSQKAFAGFSLGGLQALDAVWRQPEVFSLAGVFSGSLWWRSRDLGEGYDDDQHRIMHQQIRQGKFAPHLGFYFTTGSLDETADRNNNGVIDAIDDTLDLVKELKAKGYADTAIAYVNDENGRHDVATWARALPGFLQWGWGVSKTARPLSTANQLLI